MRIKAHHCRSFFPLRNLASPDLDSHSDSGSFDEIPTKDCRPRGPVIAFVVSVFLRLPLRRPHSMSWDWKVCLFQRVAALAGGCRWRPLPWTCSARRRESPWGPEETCPTTAWTKLVSAWMSQERFSASLPNLAPKLLFETVVPHRALLHLRRHLPHYFRFLPWRRSAFPIESWPLL